MTDRNKLFDLMKYPQELTLLGGVLTVAALAMAGIATANLHAADQKPAVGQRRFPSPDAAVSALQAAAQGQDMSAMRDLFGPQFDQLLTGDEVQDSKGVKKFATVMAEGCKQVNDSANKITLELGTNGWPLPIPLVKANGQWHFDTAAGKIEIINRHIGRDELTAIGACRAYVTAQRQYADLNPEHSAMPKYAQKFKSAPGRKDGLYWPAADNEPPSPFGQLVAQAHAEGYLPRQDSAPRAFHGYLFRILTRQGNAAQGGKKDYLDHGALVGGFALIAYPEYWDQSGVMTFMVNQDGKIYERDLGPKTLRVATAIDEYNPDNKWKLVEDEGMTDAVHER